MQAVKLRELYVDWLPTVCAMKLRISICIFGSCAPLPLLTPHPEAGYAPPVSSGRAGSLPISKLLRQHIVEYDGGL
jgi:hypothetical protein